MRRKSQCEGWTLTPSTSLPALASSNRSQGLDASECAAAVSALWDDNADGSEYPGLSLERQGDRRKMVPGQCYTQSEAYTRVNCHVRAIPYW